MSIEDKAQVMGFATDLKNKIESVLKDVSKASVGSEAWFKVNHRLIAKSIGELFFEELINPVLVNKADNQKVVNTTAPTFKKMNLKSYKLVLKKGTVYEFSAWESVWQHLRVQPDSLARNGQKNQLLASDFFIDAQSELNMDDITLGQFLEEMYSTLYSDMQMFSRYNDITVAELSLMNGHDVQNRLNGHPKILLNKGRLGWGATDLKKYSPESAEPFQLHWVAVAKDAAKFSVIDSRPQALIEKNDKYMVLPVHPWQWDQVISILYAGEIAQGKIISLGVGGDYYQPQISIRTLSNVTRPEKSDIKLSLSILNTSAVRGIPERYIEWAPQVSEAVNNICKKDSFLSSSGTQVLKDEFGISFVQPEFKKIKDAPYKYKENLGAVWRQSLASKLEADEIAILTGSLFFQDKNNKSLIGAYIEKSGLSLSDWLEKYFEIIVLPLYHLQIKYGLGLVAHGQNIVLKMKNYIPVGMFLKDFQGDLRLAQDEKFHNTDIFSETVFKSLDKLPPNYLIHDLLTGHFVTVLRFISEVLYESDHFAEQEFYSILHKKVKEYVTTQNVHFSDESCSLLRSTFERILLNKVRFKIGYGESAVRPLPMVGTPLLNPLLIKENQKRSNYE